jgi:hypothetical protein
MDKDLYDLANEINLAVSDAGIKSRAQAVMNAFTSTVLWEGHTNAYADVHGMTIYHIGKATEKDSNYSYYRSTIDLAVTTNWDEFLNACAQWRAGRRDSRGLRLRQRTFIDASWRSSAGPAATAWRPSFQVPAPPTATSRFHCQLR